MTRQATGGPSSTPPAASRVLLASLAMSLAVAAAGQIWGWSRFGLTEAATAARLERSVRHTVETGSAQVGTVARSIAKEAPLIADATTSRDHLSTLFERLQALSTSSGGRVVVATVYVPEGASSSYRVLAWSDGPGEPVLPSQRLSGPPTRFVATGHAGLRLIAVEPVPGDDRPLAVIVAETILAPMDRSTAMAEPRLSTPYGPVTLVAPDADPADRARAPGFAIDADTGDPLVHVTLHPAEISRIKAAFWNRVIAVGLLPLLAAVALLAARFVSRRDRPFTASGRWVRLAWTSAATTSVTAGAIALAWLAGVPSSLLVAMAGVGVLFLTTQIPAVLWWQAGRSRRLHGSATRFALEHLFGGLALALAIEGIARLLDRWMTIAVLDRGPFVLLPLSLPDTLSTSAVLLIETATAWLATSVLAALAIRWHAVPMRRATAALISLWILPTAVLPLLPASLAGRAGWLLMAIATSAALLALTAAWLRRTYRHTTQSARLVLALVAGLLPLVVLYPLAAVTADRASRQIIESRYSPAVAGHPQELRAELQRAQQRIDELGNLSDLVRPPAPVGSQAAFFVWSRTGLERSRVISDVELYGSDRILVSRFAFNLPDYVYRTTLQPWQGSSCTWDVFGEVTPFGAEERLMLHAERGVCDETGQLIGGVVVHVASNDYAALPFVSIPNPYYDVIGADEAGPRLPGVTLAVYGWSSQAIYSSGGAAWSMAPGIFERLYRTGEPFWIDLSAGTRSYHVHVSQNRAGVYAVGYPHVTLVEHATRLAEIAALVMVFFILWQVVLLLYARAVRRSDAPLRQLYREVRTSFYRKLFISFVGIAVMPVLAGAMAVGGYMTARFRADVEDEASTTVTVARRVFEELAAAGERTIDLQPTPSDDMMVWIRQVIGHDVTLFDGSDLVVTSQRDLFDSGLLPTRTPAMVYRAIVLDRRPVVVAEDRIGALRYVVAATPVATLGRDDAVLTVPLAPRQREMAEELDTFQRRVLVGAVFVVIFAAAIGASLARRISDPVARLTRATRQIAAGRLDVRVTTDTADELRRLVEDFNSMAATLGAQRAELARANQIQAWNEMARQVAHEIKNPLTPIQLAAEHLEHVHQDQGRPLGTVLDRCVGTITAQVRLLRQIASEFANFAGEPVSRPAALDAAALVSSIVDPYRLGLGDRVSFDVQIPEGLPPIYADRTQLVRALTNLVENAVQAMPSGGVLRIGAYTADEGLVIEVADTGVGMDQADLARAFEPYFSTKTGGSGLGLANARRYIERQGGQVSISSEPGRGTTVTVTLPVEAVRPEAPGNG